MWSHVTCLTCNFRQVDYVKLNSLLLANCLFLAYLADDDVYLEDEEERKEYVLNGNGKIWAGTIRSPFARKWEFEQVCLLQ